MSERGGRVTLAGLRLLVAVADAGGFSEAAAELGMSQSTLSEAVAGLERAVGTPLLRRTREGTVPTAAGERALEHARRAAQAADDFTLATQDASALHGEVRVISMRSAATHLLPPVIRRFMQTHPAVRIRLLDADQEGDGGLQALSQGRADVGIVPMPVASGFLAYPLLEDPYVAVVPAARGPAPLSWDEFTRVPVILNVGGNACARQVLGHLRRAGVQPGGVERVQEDSVILSMVGHGLGLTIMPSLAVQPLPAGLITLPLPVPMSRVLAVTTLATRAGLPVIRRFVETLRAEAGQRLPALEPAS